METRIDKWLWVIQIYKTRTQATAACRTGKVSVNGLQAKPSHGVKVNDLVELKWPPIVRRFRVMILADRRVSAKMVPELTEELTTPEEWKTWKRARHDPLHSMISVRERGSGRPTKKDRREMERLQGEDS